jgi:hypothetical protein
MRKKEFGLNQKDNSPDQLERFLKVVFFFVFTIPFFAFIAWYFGLFRESEVLVSKPIGRFMSMSGPGGLGNRVVIQTDLGSYPLLEAPVIAKGTPLVLELRGNDQRFVCDVPRKLCIKTSADEFSGRG